MQLFLLLMDEVTMFLTWYALFDKGLAVTIHGWPKVAGPEYWSWFMHMNGTRIFLHEVPSLCIGLFPS